MTTRTRISAARLGAFLVDALDPDEAEEIRSRGLVEPRLAARLDELARRLVEEEPRVNARVESPGRFGLVLQPDLYPQDGTLASWEAQLWTAEIFGPEFLAFLRPGKLWITTAGRRAFTTDRTCDLWAEAFAMLNQDENACALMVAAIERVAPLHWRRPPLASATEAG